MDLLARERGQPAAQRRAAGWARLAASLLGLAALQGCFEPTAMHLSISDTGSTAGDELANLSVVVGAEKSWWPSVAPGETVRVVLDPDGERPQVSLSFHAQGDVRYWSGPDLPVGFGYAMAIRVGANGRVDERHCRRPCSLAQVVWHAQENTHDIYGVEW